MSSDSGFLTARKMTDAARLTAAVAVFLAAATTTLAEPYISLRAGVQCSSCHVNQTGGGKRNDFGSTYGLTRLPAHSFPLPEGTEPFNGTLNKYVSIGADFRGANLSRFSQFETSNTFETQEANLYADLQLVPERIRLYADVRVAPGGTQSREIFAMMSHARSHIYVKAGRFFAPYGWRLLDDDAFVRSRTGYNFQSPDDGLEV